MNRIYVRISTDMQITDRQDFILKEIGYTNENSVFYEEIYSGKTKKRPVLIKMLDELEEGDNVVVTDLTRLARSVKDLWIIGDNITEKGANLISLKENVDLTTSTGKLLFTVIGAIGEFERNTLSDRTKEALAAKKANGVRLGRPKAIEENKMSDAIQFYMNGYQSMKEVSEKFNISDATLCNELRKRGLHRGKDKKRANKYLSSSNSR